MAQEQGADTLSAVKYDKGKSDGSLPWVVVDWVDSATEHRWVTVTEAKEISPYRCRSVGMLVAESLDHVILTLVETLHDEKDQHFKMVSDPLSIPRVAITRMRRFPRP